MDYHTILEYIYLYPRLSVCLGMKLDVCVMCVSNTCVCVVTGIDKTGIIYYCFISVLS